MLDVKFALSWNYRGQKGGQTLFHTAIGNFMTAMRDWSPAFRAMVEEVLQPGTEEHFLTAGNGSWAALAPSTVARKGHDTVLFDSGTLFRSFQKGGRDHVEEISRDRLRWGSRTPYALFHQTGTGAGFQSIFKAPGARGMPMRKILSFTEANKRAMRSMLVRQLAQIARREGYAVMSSQTDVDPMSARQGGSSILGL